MLKHIWQIWNKKYLRCFIYQTSYNLLGCWSEKQTFQIFKITMKDLESNWDSQYIRDFRKELETLPFSTQIFILSQIKFHYLIAQLEPENIFTLKYAPIFIIIVRHL